jgi:hypothetical protein
VRKVPRGLEGGWEGAYRVGQDDYEVVEGLFGLKWSVSVKV